MDEVHKAVNKKEPKKKKNVSGKGKSKKIKNGSEDKQKAQSTIDKVVDRVYEVGTKDTRKGRKK